MDKNGLRTPFLYKSLWTQVGWSIWWPRFWWATKGPLRKSQVTLNSKVLISNILRRWPQREKTKWMNLEGPWAQRANPCKFLEAGKSFKSSPNRITKNRQVPPEWNGSSPPSSCPRNQTWTPARKWTIFPLKRNHFYKEHASSTHPFSGAYVRFQGAHCLTFGFFPNKKTKKILQVSTKSVRGRSALKSAYISGRMMNCLTSNWIWALKAASGNSLSDHVPNINGEIPTPFSPLFSC